MKVTVITDLAAQPLSDQSTKLTPEQIALLALFGNGLQHRRHTRRATSLCTSRVMGLLKFSAVKKTM